MSDTPRTDAAILASNGQWPFVLRDCSERLEREHGKLVLAEFARQLERDLAETKHDLEFRRGLYKILEDRLSKVERELAEARAEVIEQSRLLGMGGERESDLRGKMDRLERENATLRGMVNADDPVDCLLLRLGKTQERMIDAERALRKIADCDWATTLPDRMDAVRAIAREVLAAAERQENGDVDPCKRCGSTEGFWFSRVEPMGYFCENCGEELGETP